MISIREGEAELAGWAMKSLGNEAVKARPGSVGRRRFQRSSGKSGWVEDKKAMRWVFTVLTALSTGLVL